MKRCIAVLLLIFCPFVSFAQSKQSDIRIVYVTRMVDIIPKSKDVGGFEQLGSLLKATRSSYKNSMFLNGGDFLAPSTMSSFDHGTHMIDILNSLSPDAVAVNEREFAYQEDELVLRVGEAAFPFVSYNILDPMTEGNLQGVEETICYEYDGIDICIISMVDPNVIVRYIPDRIKVNPDEERINKIAKGLRKDGAEVVILMVGHKLKDEAKMLAGSIDIILHSNSKLDAIESVGDGLVFRLGTIDGTAGLIDIKKGTDGKLAFSARIEKLIKYPVDAEIAQKINYYVSKLDKIMNVVVGELGSPLNTKKKMVRTSENAFGNLVADALREYYDTEVAIINGGSIRGNKIYEAGQKLTRRDIQTELPFRNDGVVIEVTGEQLNKALENGLSKIEDAKGRFLHVAGMNVHYCSTNPVGERLISSSMNNKKVQNGQKITLSTMDYLVSGGDGFTMLGEATPIRMKKSKLLMWEITRAYIQKYKKVSPVVEGRLIDDCKAK
ncbi:MAG: hypothetical protein C0603_10935 [Denitrovibrio sp.]|nr:MAG: hypothetical protein C0603_10935 [Denitrovibrio sp.]